MRRAAAILFAALVAAILPLFPAAAQGEADARAALDALDRAILRGTGSCEQPLDQLEDQVLLLHTQLMVTGLSCDQVLGDPRLYERYLLFTNLHEALLVDAKERLMRRFGGSEAERTEAFDSYRTRLANAESGYSQEIGPGLYCAMRRSRFETLTGATPRQFRGYALELAQRAGISLMSCPR